MGDYIDSLRRLRCLGLAAIYPGHGRISASPMEDIDRAISNAEKLLGDRRQDGVEIFYQKMKEDEGGAEVPPPA